jgi:ABC-2 type transport system ATP-binding protein
LLVPSEGGIESLRAVLDRLDAECIEVEGLSVHTPGLDDVFLALTGRTDKKKEVA